MSSTRCPQCTQKNEEILYLKALLSLETVSDESISSNLPHKKPVEDLIVNMRNLFFLILEMLLDKKNPIPLIFSSPDRHFSFAILLIIIGTLLLLFSNLMISSPNEK
jgi:hypothetical protein